MSAAVSSRADSAGICLASACAVHCMVSPLVLAALPIVGTVISGTFAEWTFMTSSLATSAVTLAVGCRRHHRRWTPVTLFAVGALLLILVRLTSDAEGSTGRIALIGGAALIAAAHGMNLHWRRIPPGLPAATHRSPRAAGAAGAATR
jgi:hypothetical protein